MCLTRVALITALAAFVAGPVTAQSGGGPEFRPKQLGDDAWVIYGAGGASLLLRDGDQVLLVDTKQPPRGDEIRALAAELAGAEPAIVINTHHHADHTGGNWAFRPPTVIFAQANATAGITANMPTYESRAIGYVTWAENHRKEQAEAARAVAQRVRDATVDDFMPTITVQSEHSLTLGDTRVNLHWFGNAHTDNDLVVHVPDANILHVGDLVFNGEVPFLDLQEGTSTAGWIAALRAALELTDDETIVIAGHGPAGDRSLLVTQIAFFEELRRVVGEAIRAGADRSAIGSLDPAAFNELGGRRLLPRALVSTYDELTSASDAEIATRPGAATTRPKAD